MGRNLKSVLVESLSIKYGTNVNGAGDLIAFRDAGRPNSPIIPEEVNDIMVNVGSEFDLRKGQLAWTAVNGDLIIQIDE